jgi:outer membrane receptor protein involved in Fe transport
VAAAAAGSFPVARSQSLPQVRLELRGGTLGEAIADIARQSGASIGTDHPEWLRRPASGHTVTGRVDVALKRILQGTGLVAVQSGPLSWRIVPEPTRPARKPLPRRIEPEPGDPNSSIVVTASKVALELSNFPGSAAVINGTKLDASGLESGTLALAALHSTLASTRLGPGRNKLFLRGIADSSFNGTSPALVGQYFEDLRLTYASPDPDLRLYDVEQVEILEGPQGTLYGAGSLGGILRIVPRRPDAESFSGTGWMGVSTTAHGGTGVDSGAVVNLPLDERVTLRTLVYSEHDAGYIDDVRRGRDNVNDSDIIGFRGVLHVRASADWSFELGAIGQNVRNADAQYTEGDDGDLTRSSAVSQPSFHDYRALSLTVEGKLGQATLRSTTGVIRQTYGQVFDATQPAGPALLFRQRDHVWLLSNETRLSGRTSRGASWLVGVAALRSDNRERRELGEEGNLASLGAVRSDVTELTGFGDFNLPIDGDFTATIGGRISSIALDGKARGAIAKPVEGGQPRRGRTQWLATPSVSLTWKPLTGLSAYARYAGGYRPGGLTVGAVAERFSPDRIRTAELGLRFQCACALSLRADASLSQSSWRNIQADMLDGLGLPHVANIGNGRVQTATMSVSLGAATDLQLSASGFVSHSKLNSDGESIGGIMGGQLPNVARYGVLAAAEKRWLIDGKSELHLGVRGQALGPSILGLGPQLAYSQGDYLTVSSFVKWLTGRLAFSLDIANFLDTRGNVFALGTPFTVAVERQSTPLRPRTVRLGVSLTY